MNTSSHYYKPLAVLLIAFQLFGCTSSHNQISNASYSKSAAEEVALGKEINSLIIARIPICTNEDIGHYVQGVGKNIAQYAKRQEIPYQFVVLQDDRIFATSAPGGFVYITSGFLLFLKNESELAYILAHEVGELQTKDPRLSHTRKALENALKTGAVVAPAFGTIGALATLGIIGVAAVTNRTASPDKKIYTADRKALEMMAKSGYDPQSAIDALRGLWTPSSKELMNLYDYYQARPVTAMRVKKLEEAFQGLNLKNQSFDTNRTHYLKMIEPLKPVL